MKGLLVSRLDGALGLGVELVEPRLQRVVDAPLALAHQPHDHCASPFGSACWSPPEPWPSSDFSFASSSSTWLLWEI